jgi:hypothetical protein
MEREQDLHRERDLRREPDLRERLAQCEIDARAGTARRNAEVQARHDEEVERFLLQQRQAFQEENGANIEEFRQDAVPEFLRHFVRSGRVNIAVLGSPGAGRTSLISAHGGVKKVAACAKVGAEECARRPTPYVTESGDVLWDLPASDRQDLSYLRFFDVAVLVTMGDYTEAESALERALERFQVPCLCVRNKVDLALEWIRQEADDQGRALEDERTQSLEQETLQELRTLFRHQHGSDHVYLVSSKLEHRSAFDFDRFRRDLWIAVQNFQAERTCSICLELFAEFGGPEQCKRRVSVCHHSWCHQCDGHGIRCCPVCRRVLQ